MHIIFSLQNLIFCKNFVLNFMLQALFLRKGKDPSPSPEPDPDPYLWLMDRIPNTAYNQLFFVSDHWAVVSFRLFSPVFARRFWPDDVFILTDGILTIFSYQSRLSFDGLFRLLLINMYQQWVK